MTSCCTFQERIGPKISGCIGRTLTYVFTFSSIHKFSAAKTYRILVFRECSESYYSWLAANDQKARQIYDYAMKAIQV